ncbi:hypothetical protein ALT721_1370007 [Alteromonas alvinellae]
MFVEYHKHFVAYHSISNMEVVSHFVPENGAALRGFHVLRNGITRHNKYEGNLYRYWYSSNYLVSCWLTY